MAATRDSSKTIMKLWAIMMVKDEADIIEYTVEHLFRQKVDGLLIYDNMSSDETGEILAILARRHCIGITLDTEVGYYQSRKMTELAEIAANHAGADWILPVDADEWWHAPGGLSIKAYLEIVAAVEPETKALSVPMVNHFCTGLDAPSMNPFARMCWAKPDSPCLPKVCFRGGVLKDFEIAMGNHELTHRGGVAPYPTSKTSHLFAKHFPYRSADHFVRKAVNGAAAYAATNLPPEYGDHWRGYGAMIAQHGEQAGRDWFQRWFYYDDPRAAGMHRDPVEEAS